MGIETVRSMYKYMYVCACVLVCNRSQTSNSCPCSIFVVMNVTGIVGPRFLDVGWLSAQGITSLYAVLCYVFMVWDTCIFAWNIIGASNKGTC